eukprot:TRINITY_DN4451_c0_g1_i10.p1 TRINITY_DN4451_c0_g1~~TRINITY_DN4451_c0_g1_i10.p1  ORF type:complete len:1021 (+),score=170.89 TRINITY_DN4451_c0_g1_i10:42-3065(+)
MFFRVRQPHSILHLPNPKYVYLTYQQFQDQQQKPENDFVVIKKTKLQHVLKNVQDGTPYVGGSPNSSSDSIFGSFDGCNDDDGSSVVGDEWVNIDDSFEEEEEEEEKQGRNKSLMIGKAHVINSDSEESASDEDEKISSSDESDDEQLDDNEFEQLNEYESDTENFTQELEECHDLTPQLSPSISNQNRESDDEQLDDNEFEQLNEYESDTEISTQKLEECHNLTPQLSPSVSNHNRESGDELLDDNEDEQLNEYESDPKDSIEIFEECHNINSQLSSITTNRNQEVQRIYSKNSQPKTQSQCFEKYIYKVLKQKFPQMEISQKAMAMMNQIVVHEQQKIANEASKLSRYNRISMLGSSEIQTAVRLLFPGQLAIHAVQEGNKAIRMFARNDQDLQEVQDKDGDHDSIISLGQKQEQEEEEGYDNVYDDDEESDDQLDKNVDATRDVKNGTKQGNVVSGNESPDNFYTQEESSKSDPSDNEQVQALNKSGYSDKFNEINFNFKQETPRTVPPGEFVSADNENGQLNLCEKQKGCSSKTITCSKSKSTTKNKVINFKPYISKVFKQVHPSMKLTNRALILMNALLADILQVFTQEASILSKYPLGEGKGVLSDFEIDTAVRYFCSGDLSYSAASYGKKALEKYNKELEEEKRQVNQDTIESGVSSANDVGQKNSQQGQIVDKQKNDLGKKNCKQGQIIDKQKLKGKGDWKKGQNKFQMKGGAQSSKKLQTKKINEKGVNGTQVIQNKMINGQEEGNNFFKQKTEKEIKKKKDKMINGQEGNNFFKQKTEKKMKQKRDNFPNTKKGIKSSQLKSNQCRNKVGNAIAKKDQKRQSFCQENEEPPFPQNSEIKQLKNVFSNQKNTLDSQDNSRTINDQANEFNPSILSCNDVSEVSDIDDDVGGDDQLCSNNSNRPKNLSNLDFSNNIYKVLKIVHPGLGISRKSMQVVNSVVEGLFNKISNEASLLVKYNKSNMLTSREIQTAVRLIVPNVLALNAVTEGTKAEYKFRFS